mgnify:CR=1 FL=1
MKNLGAVKIFTKDHCPFCVFLKKYLTKNEIEFENISVDHDEALYRDLKAKTNHQTVPQIFIDNKFIGGSEDFLEYIEHWREHHEEAS